MIFLSVGMPRAGSGWYYNLTNDLALAAGFQDARRIRQRYRLQGILTEVNCNIGALTMRRLVAVLAPSIMGNSFVIKAHAGPTPVARRLIRLGLIRPAYIYRDPRDALLSAMEMGRRARQDGRQNAFSKLVDFESALDFMTTYLNIWEAWMACERALHTRYEDLLLDYDSQARRLVDFLGLDTSQPAIQEVVARYRPAAAQPDQPGLHFNKGKIGRFRDKLSDQEQAVMQARFGPFLKKMGYPR
jgi:hypothetical protein